MASVSIHAEFRDVWPRVRGSTKRFWSPLVSKKSFKNRNSEVAVSSPGQHSQFCNSDTCFISKSVVIKNLIAGGMTNNYGLRQKGGQGQGEDWLGIPSALLPLKGSGPKLLYHWRSIYSPMMAFNDKGGSGWSSVWPLMAAIFWISRDQLTNQIWSRTLELK